MKDVDQNNNGNNPEKPDQDNNAWKQPSYYQEGDEQTEKGLNAWPPEERPEYYQKSNQ